MANPALICQQLLSQLRLSNLNFLLSETPYSAQIILRKRFVKECLGPEAAFLLAPDQIDNKNEVINLREEIVNLKKELEALEIARNVEKDKEKILEEKIGNIEAEALKAYKKQEAEISTMKNLNRNLNTEIDKLKSEMSSKIKSCKQKDKEVQRLENKCDNLASNLKQIKNENKDLKSKYTKLEKSSNLEKTSNLSKKTPLNNKSVDVSKDSNQNIKTTESVEKGPAFSTHDPGTPCNSPPGSPSRTLGTSCQLSSSGTPSTSTSCTRPSSDAILGPSEASPSTTRSASTTAINNILPARPTSSTSACSSHTPPGTPPDITTGTYGIPPPSSAYASAALPITEEYIAGINQIDLGPRVNDLSKL